MINPGLKKGSRTTRRSSSKSPHASTTDPERARLTAIEHCLFHYPTLFTAGVPRHLPLSDSELWVVPILLTHPDRGAVGEVGVVAVDRRTGKVVGSTPRDEVVAAGEWLAKGKRFDLHTAPAQARS